MYLNSLSAACLLSKRRTNKKSGNSRLTITAMVVGRFSLAWQANQPAPQSRACLLQHLNQRIVLILVCQVSQSSRKRRIPLHHFSDEHV
jgi:hypothetical protein